MNDPAWHDSCCFLKVDPWDFYSTETTKNDFFQVIWDTRASEVNTSNPTDFIGGYNKPTLPLQLHGVSLGAMAGGIGIRAEKKHFYLLSQIGLFFNAKKHQKTTEFFIRSSSILF